MTILFLDYDGVLHDAEVFIFGREPVLRSKNPEAEFFEHVDLLIEALAPRPDVKIVLSTSWVPRLGFDRAKSYLPQELQARVIGATYHRHAHGRKADWLSYARFMQIESYVRRHQLNDWIAVDDDDQGWPVSMRQHLVFCKNPSRGIADPEVCADLKRALGQRLGGPGSL